MTNKILIICYNIFYVYFFVTFNICFFVVNKGMVVAVVVAVVVVVRYYNVCLVLIDYRTFFSINRLIPCL